MEEFDEVIKQELYYEKFKYESIDKVIESLNELYLYLINKFENTDEISRREISKQLKEVQEELDIIYGGFYDNVEVDLYKVSNSFIKSELKIVGLKKDSKRILENIFNIKNDIVLNYTLQQMINSHQQQHYNRFKKTFSSLMLGGDRPDDWAQQLNDVVVGKTNSQLKTIARTYAKHIREKARDDIEQEDGVSDKFIGWISISTLDSRISAVCIKHDKEKYLKKDGFKSRLDIPEAPPRHFNCRSIITRLSNTNESFSRASKGDEGGQQVQGKTDFDSFLRRNPITAEKILGKKKSQFFLNNRFKIDRFIGDDGDFLTIEEIEADLL